MATINAPANERRHIVDRRTTGVIHKTTINALDWIALTLVSIGGLNWGLVGLINKDVVAALFGVQTPASRVIYVVIGLAALYSIYTTIKLAASSPPAASS
jgi:uncharacterized membrane protein YuzA (DUF378 family)